MKDAGVRAFRFGRVSSLHGGSVICWNRKSATQSLILWEKTCEYAHVQKQEDTLKKA